MATLYGYDQLGRTALVTETGLLDGAFDPTTLRFSSAATRVTRTEYDAFSRPLTVTLNYRLDQPIGTLPDVNVQTITYYDGAGNVTWQRDGLGRWSKTEYDALNRLVKTIRNYENGQPHTVETANQGWTDGSDTDLVSVTVFDSAGRVEREIDNYVDGGFSATEPITDRVTLYQYDSLSRVITTTLNYAPGQSGNDLNRSSLSAYDPTTARLLGRRDPLGRWTSRQYDALIHVVTRSYVLPCLTSRFRTRRPIRCE